MSISLRSHLWDVRGNWINFKNLMQAWGEHANSTQKRPWWGVSFFSHQCYKDMTSNEMMLLEGLPVTLLFKNCLRIVGL